MSPLSPGQQGLSRWEITGEAPSSIREASARSSAPLFIPGQAWQGEGRVRGLAGGSRKE